MNEYRELLCEDGHVNGAWGATNKAASDKIGRCRACVGGVACEAPLRVPQRSCGR